MNILDDTQIKDIKVCGKFLANALKKVEEAIKPGVFVLDLDQLAEEFLVSNGCVPAFKDYFVEGVGSFPSTLCVSINDEIVHGIPKEGRKLAERDIVSVDIGAGYHGVYTDMAATFAVGKISDEAKRLIEGTKHSLVLGIEKAVAGGHIGDIGAAVERYAKDQNLGVIRDYVGHGIGTKPHLAPQIPNFGVAGTGPEIKERMALAIEPMLTLGDFRTVVEDDDWTVKTLDHSLAAHFEHTVVIENGKPVIVTTT